MSRRRSVGGFLALIAVAASVPGTAAAATVSVPGACHLYLPDGKSPVSEPIDLKLDGFAPTQLLSVALQIGGTNVSGVPSLTADGTGSLVSQIPKWTSGLEGPTPATDARVVVSDFMAGTEVAAATIKISNVAFKVTPAGLRKPTTKRTWEVSGLNQLYGGRTYYAFYFKGKRTLVGKQRLGQARDECGYLKARRRLIPFSAFGSFQMRIQASSTFHAKQPWLGAEVSQRAR